MKPVSIAGTLPPSHLPSLNANSETLILNMSYLCKQIVEGARDDYSVQGILKRVKNFKMTECEYLKSLSLRKQVKLFSHYKKERETSSVQCATRTSYQITSWQCLFREPCAGLSVQKRQKYSGRQIPAFFFPWSRL